MLNKRFKIKNLITTKTKFLDLLILVLKILVVKYIFEYEMKKFF